MVVNKKRLGSLLMALIMLAMVFTGCQQKEPSDQKGTEQTQTQATTAKPTDPLDKYSPVEGKKYEISWLVVQQAAPEADAEMVKHWEDKFNVKFNLVYIPAGSEASNQLNLKLASGEIPDVLGGSGDFYQLATQGVLAELPDAVLEKYLPSALDQMKVEFPDVMKYGLVNGKRYGVLNTIFLPNKSRTPIIYNGLWMKNLGVEKTPETLQEFEDLMYKFKNSDPDKNNKNDTYGLSRSSMMAVFGAYGAIPGYFASSTKSNYSLKWQLSDGKAVNTAILPEMKEALRVLNKWYKDGVLDPEFITGENTGGYWALSQAFINQRIGVSSLGSFYHWSPELPGRAAGNNYVEIKKINEEMADTLMYGQPPVGPGGKSGMNKNEIVSSSYLMLGSPLEKEPDKMGKIMQIIDYMNATFTEDPAITFMYGIRGKHWDYDANKVIVGMDKYKDPAELQKIGAWGTFQRFSFEKRFMMTEPALYIWAEQNGFNKGGLESVVPGMVVLPSASKFKAELERIEQEAYISIITGDKPIDYFDEFVKIYQAAGGEQVEKEANEWYQAAFAK